MESKRLIENDVLKGWAKRCGGSLRRWNETVGKALGFTASAN